MNAPNLKELEAERDYLKSLNHKLFQPHLIFTVALDNAQLHGNLLEEAKFGISHYVTIRLMELEAQIARLTKENNA